VFDPQAAAAAYGLTIERIDLGAWGDRVTLVAEYDGRARRIRINERALAAYRRTRSGDLSAADIAAFLDRVVAHELYHHREAIGEIARLPSRAQREVAAEAFAREESPADSRLDAFFAANPAV
jgi:hypothetical protein